MKKTSMEIKDASKEDIASKSQVYANKLKLKEETNINKDIWTVEYGWVKEIDDTTQHTTKEEIITRINTAKDTDETS